MNGTNQRASTALQQFEPATDVAYSIESVVHITQLPRHLIAVYCRHGLISPLAPPEREGWWFDDEAIRALRRIGALRSEYGLNLRGIQAFSTLINEVEHLRDEIRFLRG